MQRIRWSLRFEIVKTKLRRLQKRAAQRAEIAKENMNAFVSVVLDVIDVRGK